MNNRMPCGLDDDRIRFAPDVEDDDPRTDTEKRLMWIEDEWASARHEDTYESWNDVRLMAFGAVQALINAECRNVPEIAQLREIGDFAFENSMTCIKEGRYEGAPQ